VKVKAEDLGTGRSLNLSADQTSMFSKELALIKKRPPFRKLPPTLAPDTRITVSDGKKKTEYELYNRFLLYEPKSKKGWFFYFGVLLSLWVNK